MAQEGMTWVGHVWSISYQHYDFSVKSKIDILPLKKFLILPRCSHPFSYGSRGPQFFLRNALAFPNFFAERWRILHGDPSSPSSPHSQLPPVPPTPLPAVPGELPADFYPGFGFWFILRDRRCDHNPPCPTPWDLWMISTTELTESTKNSFRSKIELLLGFWHKSLPKKLFLHWFFGFGLTEWYIHSKPTPASTHSAKFWSFTTPGDLWTGRCLCRGLRFNFCFTDGSGQLLNNNAYGGVVFLVLFAESMCFSEPDFFLKVFFTVPAFCRMNCTQKWYIVRVLSSALNAYFGTFQRRSAVLTGRCVVSNSSIKRSRWWNQSACIWMNEVCLFTHSRFLYIFLLENILLSVWQ